MVSEDLELLVEKLPLTRQGTPPAADVVARYRGRVPDTLLRVWGEVGFAGFGNGTMWLTDPDEWDDVADLLVQHADLGPFPPGLEWIPVARSAFGRFWFWNSTYGMALDVNPVLGTAYHLDESAHVARHPELVMENFLDTCDSEQYDFFDEREVGLFEAAHRRLGHLGPDEVYGFVPAIALGGAVRADNLQVFPMREHLVLLTEFGGV